MSLRFSKAYRRNSKTRSTSRSTESLDEGSANPPLQIVESGALFKAPAPEPRHAPPARKGIFAKMFSRAVKKSSNTPRD